MVVSCNEYPPQPVPERVGEAFEAMTYVRQQMENLIPSGGERLPGFDYELKRIEERSNAGRRK
jgi:hypothetical protein